MTAYLFGLHAAPRNYISPSNETHFFYILGIIMSVMYTFILGNWICRFDGTHDMILTYLDERVTLGAVDWPLINSNRLCSYRLRASARNKRIGWEVYRKINWRDFSRELSNRFHGILSIFGLFIRFV